MRHSFPAFSHRTAPSSSSSSFSFGSLLVSCLLLLSVAPAIVTASSNPPPSPPSTFTDLSRLSQVPTAGTTTESLAQAAPQNLYVIPNIHIRIQEASKMAPKEAQLKESSRITPTFHSRLFAFTLALRSDCSPFMIRLTPPLAVPRLVCSALLPPFLAQPHGHHGVRSLLDTARS
jgi:hypothetical protein